MAELIMFIIASAGITYIIVYGSILSSIRSWLSAKSSYIEDLISCTLCTGFWVGLALSMFTTISLPYAAGIAAISAMVVDLIIDLIREMIALVAAAQSYLQSISLSKAHNDVTNDLVDDIVEDITDEI